MATANMLFVNVVLGAAFLLSSVCDQVYSRKELPVGAFFDNDEQEINTGFRYKVQYDLHQTDNRHSSVKLDLDDRVAFIDTGDAFAVSEQVCDFLEKGIFVLFGSHRVDTIETLRSYSKTFHMPYITTSMAYNESDQDRGYQLYMQPYYMMALLSICKSKRWKNVMYMYDSDEGLARIHQIYGELAVDGYPLTMDLYRVTSVDEAYDALVKWSTREDRPRNIMLDLPTSDCDALFGMAANSTVLLSFNFLIVGLGINEMYLGGYKLHGGFNVTGFSMIDPESAHVKKFLESWQALSEQMYPGAGQDQISYEAALAVDAVGVIQTALSKILDDRSGIFNANWKKDRFFNNRTEGIHCDADDVMPWEHGHEIMKKIGEIDYVGMTGQVRFDSSRLRKDYRLFLYELQKSRGYNRGEPYLEIRNDVPGLKGNDRYIGYCADLAEQLAIRLDMDYELRQVKDGNFGTKQENGSWNGVVGELVRREADMAVAPLTITSERETVIDFSKPFMSLGISIMVKKMTKETPGVFSFMYPLSYEIWMCVIFAYIGVSVVLFLVSRFSPFEWHIEDNTEGPTVTNNFTIFNSLWFSLGAFMQQGCDIEPRSMSGRIVGSVWWFFTLIIISSYTANLAAFLTVQRMTSPIESAEDLAKQTEIKYGTIDSGTTKEFFRSSTIPVYNRMWTFMESAEPSVFVKNNDEGVGKVRNSDGKYAFLIESTTNEYQNQQEPCDTMKVGDNLDSKGYGIATPVGSPWRDEITLAILTFREQGLLQTLEKRWWYEKGSCGKEASKESTNSLKLGNVAGIFYILTTGLLLALLMAVIEFLYKSKMEARRRKTSFTNAVRTKARLSIKGKPERQTTAYTYAPAAQLISLDGYADGANTHTQV